MLPKPVHMADSEVHVVQVLAGNAAWIVVAAIGKREDSELEAPAAKQPLEVLEMDRERLRLGNGGSLASQNNNSYTGLVCAFSGGIRSSKLKIVELATLLARQRICSVVAAVDRELPTWFAVRCRRSCVAAAVTQCGHNKSYSKNTQQVNEHS